jgi:hypothetical protein
MTYLTSLYIRWRYLVLLGTLLLVLVVQPISFGFSTPPQLFDAFLMLVTVALLLSFCPDKNRRLAAIAFGISTGLLSLGGHLFGANNTVVLIGHCLAVVFYFWAALSTPARTCAWLEALTGQFYLAVLVAGLVGALNKSRQPSGKTRTR